MSRSKRAFTSGVDTAESLVDEAESIVFQQVDQAGCVLRPSEISTFYVEEQFHAKSAEQPLLFTAKGEAAARTAEMKAAGLEKQASDATDFAEGHKEVVSSTRKWMLLAEKVLRPLARRAKGDKLTYCLQRVGLLGGDIAGVAGAAIFYGELPSLAIMQAVASGTAAVTAGVVGGEVKDLVRASQRKKPAEELSEDEQHFASLFRGPSGETIVKLVCALSGLIAALIACAVTALRTTTEGLTAGITFGCLAAAISLASVVAAYAYADEVADKLDATVRDYRRELKFGQKLSASPARRTYEEAKTEAASIRAEHAELGKAAAKAVLVLLARVLHNNPSVAGHGRAAESSTEPMSAGELVTQASISTNGKDHQ